MNRARIARALCALVALLIIVLARAATAQFLSPGPLSRAHSSLEGDTNCGQCHTSGKRVDQRACLKCHADLGARIAAGQGLHGFEYRGQPCEKCHTEHLGVGTSQVRWPGGDPSRLDHAQTGWPLDGAHKTTTCNKCHDPLSAHGGARRSVELCVLCHTPPESVPAWIAETLVMGLV